MSKDQAQERVVGRATKARTELKEFAFRDIEPVDDYFHRQEESVKESNLTDLMNSLQHSLETVQVTASPRRDEREAPPFWEEDPRPAEPVPVESLETREDSSDS